MKKQILIICSLVFLVFLLLIFYSQHFAKADIANGLVGYWNFNETGGITAIDSSDSNNTGTLVNGPTWTTGKINNALSFDGVDDYVNVDDIPFRLVNGTIAAWFKFNSASVYEALISKSAAGYHDDFALSFDSNKKLNFSIDDSLTSTSKAIKSNTAPQA